MITTLKHLQWHDDLDINNGIDTDSDMGIDHFIVVSLVAWPLNESEAGGTLALIETSLLFYINDAVLMLIGRNLHS